MAASVVDFHPEARAEANAAADWYRVRSPSAAQNFVVELERGIAHILRNPATWPRHLHGTHRYILSRFPFGIVYRVQEMSVQIYAVAHLKRRPGYWRKRRFNR